MLRPAILVLAVVLALATPACIVAIGDFEGTNTLIGSGVERTEVRPVVDFKKIRVEGSADVIATIGSTTSLSVTGDDNLIPYVTTVVEGGVLVVDMKPGSYHWRHGLRVEVTTPTLENVSIDGSADVNVNGLSGGSFGVDISGSGSLRGFGSVDKLTVSVSGSGDLRLYDVVAREVHVTISGSGDAQVHATDTLIAEVSGSGDIRYRGNPRNPRLSISGSGSVAHD